MRIFKDIPEVQGFLNAFAAEEGDFHIDPLVDWLMEEDATLAEVLMLFAAGPPNWLHATWRVDEALWRVVGKWCKMTEPIQPSPAHLPTRSTLGMQNAQISALEKAECRYRWQFVNHVVWDVDAIWNLYRRKRTYDPPVAPVTPAWIQEQNRKHQPQEAANIDRDLKRRILSLFPDASWIFRGEMWVTDKEVAESYEGIEVTRRTLINNRLSKWNDSGVILSDGLARGALLIDNLRRPLRSEHPTDLETWRDDAQRAYGVRVTQTRHAPDWVPDTTRIRIGQQLQDLPPGTSIELASGNWQLGGGK